MTTQSTAIGARKVQLGRCVKHLIFIVGMVLALFFNVWMSASMRYKFDVDSKLIIQVANYLLFLLAVPFGSFLLFAQKGKTDIIQSEKLSNIAKKAAIIALIIAAISFVFLVAIFVYLTCFPAKPKSDEFNGLIVVGTVNSLFFIISTCIILAQSVQCATISRLGRSAIPLFLLNGGMLGLNGVLYRIYADIDMTVTGARPYVYNSMIEILIFAGVTAIIVGIAVIVTKKVAKKNKILA